MDESRMDRAEPLEGMIPAADGMPAGGAKTEWYELVTLEEAKAFITARIRTAAVSFCAVGYYLKNIRDRELYREDGYGTVWEFAREEFGISKSTASRYMTMNDRFSKGGNSPILDERYQGYDKSKLQEMLSLTDAQMDQVTPEMNVRQIRELRQPREIPYVEIPGQMEISDFFGDGVVGEKGSFPPAEAAGNFWGAAAIERSELAGMDEDLTGRSGSAAPPPRISEDGQRSAYGTPRRIPPEGSLLNMKGCEGGHYCNSCSMECSIRQEERWCRYAPCGNPFPCDTLHYGLDGIRETVGDACEFINHGLAHHRAGDHEPDPCCKNCQNPCEYICERAMRALRQQEEGQGQDELGTEAAAGIVAISQQSGEEPDERQESDEQFLRRMLGKEKTMLEEMIKVDRTEPLPPDMLRRQKLLVGALAGMLCDMESMEAGETEEAAQPELPPMKNNDQRKKWLRNYRAWGLWYVDGHIGARYYKYDFECGARLIAEEYEDCMGGNGHTYTSSYLHLVGGPEPPRHPMYGEGRWSRHEVYSRYPDSETELVEFLKFVQKGENNGKTDRA